MSRQQTRRLGGELAQARAGRWGACLLLDDGGELVLPEGGHDPRTQQGLPVPVNLVEQARLVRLVEAALVMQLMHVALKPEENEVCRLLGAHAVREATRRGEGHRHSLGDGDGLSHVHGGEGGGVARGGERHVDTA
eukprot:scaffold23270_cov65-Phaeocystis_antarctica.AAC.2